MNLLKHLKGAYLGWKIDQSKKRVMSLPLGDAHDSGDFSHSLADPTIYYLYCFQEFHRNLPSPLRQHREYFTRNSRGFGEDAFHVMWWNLIRRFKPASFLEIGVYRGQTLSLVSLIATMNRIPCNVTGISPFASVGDSVSKYREGLDYLEDTLSNFSHFGLPEPELIKAYSTDPVAVDAIRRSAWDCIYIDGNHDYEVVKQDWMNCAEACTIGGIIVLDDSGLSTAYRPPTFATGGHPGPSRLAGEIEKARFQEILQVGHNRVFQKLS